MSRILDLTPRKKTILDASTLTPMEPISTPLERDLFLAAVSTVPAAILWIGFDFFYTGIAVAVSIFIIMEYTLPAYRRGAFDFSFLLNAYAHAREIVRSRVVRGA